MKITNLFKNFSFIKSANKRADDYPDAHWKITASVFLILIFAVIVFHLFLFFRVKEGKLFSIEGSDEPQSVGTINLADLSRVAEKYKEKRELFSELRRSKNHSPDPSR